MNLRSTRDGLNQTIRRFRGAADVRITGSHRGAIEPGFTDWVRGHWSLSSPRLFRPAAISFHRPKNTFEFASWPKAPAAGPQHYTFSPSIQLTFPGTTLNLPGITLQKTLYETAARSVFLSSSRPFAVQNPGWERQRTTLERVLESLTHHSRLVERETEGKRLPALRSHSTSRLDHFPPLPVGRAQSRDTALAPLFITILRAAQRWTRTLQVKGVQEGLEPRQITEAFTRNDLVRSMLSLPNLPRAPNDGLRATPTAQSLVRRLSIMLSLPNLLQAGNVGLNPTATRSLLTLLTGTHSRSEPANHTSFSAGPSLTILSRPGWSGAKEAQLQSRNVHSSPSLNYANRDSEQLQGALTALRDLHAAQSQLKPPPAAVMPSIEQLTGQVYQQLERELRIERERRGL